MSFETGVTALAQAIGADIKGLKITPPVEITGDVTLTSADSGKHLVYNGFSTILITFPASLPLGFKIRISNSGRGIVLFDKGGRLSFGNASRDALTFQWDVVEVFLTVVNTAGVFLQTYNLGLPNFYQVNDSALTRNATTMSAITGISVPLEINAAYDIDLIASFSSSIATNTLKLGFTGLPTGASCQLQGVVFNTNAQGTAPCVHKVLFTSADVITGVSGTSAVVNATVMARITGRIITSSTAGNLIPTCGSIAATGNVSIAAGGVTISVNKVFDQGRT